MEAELRPSVLSGSALLLAWTLSACASDTKPANADGSAGAAGSAVGTGGATGGNFGEQTLSVAQWPMPNSPGLGLRNPASYEASTAGVVHDLVTDLDWLQDPGIELYPRAEAIARCADLSFADFDDWRVPEFIELVSLFEVVPNLTDPMDPLYISPIFKAEGRFWSMTAPTSTGLGRLLDFTAAGCGSSPICSIGVAANVEAALGGAFCVRNSQPPKAAPRYVQVDTQVVDLHTSLTWLSVPASMQTGAYAEALSACDALGSGARLPSVTELLSILVPILDKTVFPGWPADAFGWTSSAMPEKPDAYWVAAIGGATKVELSSSHNRVECVR
ncbi:MAG TPA: hypothetical protein VGC79_22885 [Polyangiaceae bacterium]